MNLEESAEIYNRNHKDFIEKTPDVEWKEQGFSLEEAINKTRGILLEIAGPTPAFKQIEDFSKINKQLMVSNIDSGVKLYDHHTGEYVGTIGKVDIRADAVSLPLENESVGTLMISCLPVGPSKKAVEEIRRVIENGGLVVWEGTTKETMKAMVENGFELKAYQQMDFENGSVYNFVCQKTSPHQHTQPERD